MKKANDNVDIENLHDNMIKFVTDLEEVLGYELTITSGYRSPEHPIEKAKSKPGEHTEGLAIDVACSTPTEFLNLVGKAYQLGCKRIGVSRKSGFVHLGLSPNRYTSLWTY